MAERILLSSPHMSEEGFELEYIRDAFRKNWIAPLGENVTEFEGSMVCSVTCCITCRRITGRKGNSACRREGYTAS